METLSKIIQERFAGFVTWPGAQVSLRAKQSLFTRMVALLIIKAYDLGYEVTFGDTTRHDSYKKDLLHFIRLAIDLNLFREGKYLRSTDDHRVLGEFWESLGGSWGGRFGDGNHYSLGHGGKK